MKDKIIGEHSTLGYITYKDLYNDLCILLDDYYKLENSIKYIMKNNDYNNQKITSLLSDDISSRLEWLIYVLEDLL